MPSYNFEIERYHVSTSIVRLPSQTRIERVLELTGYPLAHGARARAALVFSNMFNVFTTPVVGYLWFEPTGPRVNGWLPLGEFGFYYDIIRSEWPIRLVYDTRPGETTGYLTRLRLGTP